MSKIPTASSVEPKPKIKTDLKQHVDFTFDTKYDTENLDNLIDNIETNQKDFDITNFTDAKKLKKIQDEYIKRLQQQKDKNKESTEKLKTESGKTVIKAETVAGSRKTAPKQKTNAIKELEKEAKENGVNKEELLKKVKETIKNLEEEAKKLEESDEFKMEPKKLEEDVIEKSREFLFSTYISSTFINSNGISTDKFISEMINETYSTKHQPKENLLDSTPKQLIYILRLSKYLDTKLLQQSNTQLSFNNVDLAICNYFKEHNKIPDYKIAYGVLKEFFKKLIITSLSDVELAFRSQNNWISPEFKKLILKDVVMLQSLPPKLAKSWKIFVEELCKINDANIFNDISKLDYVIHIETDFIIEETLAKSIKCMTPCFIYNYYNVAKSVYILCGLLDKWIDDVKNKRIENDYNTLYSTLYPIIKTCLYLYENTRLYENSTARSLPYSKDKISEELQMYYLNHTIMGPQYMLLKSLEKHIIALI